VGPAPQQDDLLELSLRRGDNLIESLPASQEPKARVMKVILPKGIRRDRLEINTESLAWRGTEADAPLPRRPEAGEQDAFRNALNQTVIFLASERFRDRILKVALLSNNSPTFERFLIRSDESTAWVPTTSNTFKWLLHPGMNELSARIETRDGWRASVSSMRLFYKPPLVESLPSFRGNILRFIWHRSV